MNQVQRTETLHREAWGNKNTNVKESKSAQKDLVTRMAEVRYNVHRGHAE